MTFNFAQPSWVRQTVFVQRIEGFTRDPVDSVGNCSEVYCKNLKNPNGCAQSKNSTTCARLCINNDCSLYDALWGPRTMVSALANLCPLYCTIKWGRVISKVFFYAHQWQGDWFRSVFHFPRYDCLLGSWTGCRLYRSLPSVRCESKGKRWIFSMVKQDWRQTETVVVPLQ